MHVLFGLQTLFSLLLLAHAIKTGREYYWWICIMVPFGEWVYFFAVFLDSPEWRNIKKKWFTSTPNLKNLEHDAKTSPSVHNRLQLAQAYHDGRRHAEARDLFQQVLAQDQENREALYGLGLCQQELGNRDEAIRSLEQVVKLDMAYADFEACRHLVEALWESDNKPESLDLARRLARRSERVSHKTQLGGYLVKSDLPTEAKQVLQETLEDYENSPAYIRRSDRKWARMAKDLLANLQP